jgi:hypothetical protein
MIIYPTSKNGKVGEWSILRNSWETAAVYDFHTGERIDPPLIYEDVDTGKRYLPRELDWAGSKIMV